MWVFYLEKLKLYFWEVDRLSSLRNTDFVKQSMKLAKSISLSQLFVFGLGCLCFLLQQFFIVPNSIKRSDYLPPPAIVKNMSIGMSVQLSDSFWLRALQDFDYCDQKINSTECKGKSWLFQVLDLATDLDPKFQEAFFYGGLALTVIISDYDGATKIFDKGVYHFPKKWQLNYAAGYHSMIEEKNFKKAADRYLAAAENGAPSWVRILAGTLAAKGGDTEFAEKVIEQMISMNEEPKYIERLKMKLENIKNNKPLPQ